MVLSTAGVWRTKHQKYILLPVILQQSFLHHRVAVDCLSQWGMSTSTQMVECTSQAALLLLRMTMLTGLISLVSYGVHVMVYENKLNSS